MFTVMNTIKLSSIKLEHLVLFLCTCTISTVYSSTSNETRKAMSPIDMPLAGNRPTYELVDWTVVTPQWLKIDLFEMINVTRTQSKYLRFPPEDRRFGFTRINQEPIVLSTRELQLVPSASKLLKMNKKPRQVIERTSYQPLLSTGVNARHAFAEGIHIRWRHIGASDDTLIAFLFMPSGWPFALAVAFIGAVIFVPLLGACLIHTGFEVAKLYKFFLWGPLKALIRWILIREQLRIKRWEKYIAPSYFLEPRTSWKLPFFLRNDSLEDIPYELAYKPPINKIDYTNYILTEEDYDEMDLGMDEMEYIDDLLQFRDENPKVVARLLKHKLGVEKFYNYFDEDILSDESDVEEEPTPVISRTSEVEQEPDGEPQEKKNKYEYLGLLDIDEPWMHDEYDKTFTGSLFQLEEIRKRRQIIRQLKDEVTYYHNLILRDNKYDANYVGLTKEERKKTVKKTNRLLDKFVRYSNITKERIAEIEPSSKKQASRNPALSKYLPLVDHLSHYNHRLNLKHLKQTDPARRKVQLGIFGGP